ncbi:MAG: hypothetical protein WCT53_01410 [Candidatus Gracilibacteria bacterium]
MNTPQEEPKISHAGAVADAKQLIHRLYGESTGQAELTTNKSRAKSQELFKDLAKPAEEAPKDASAIEMLYREAGAFLSKFNGDPDALGFAEMRSLESSGKRVLSELKGLVQSEQIDKAEAHRLGVVLTRFYNLARRGAQSKEWQKNMSGSTNAQVAAALGGGGGSLLRPGERGFEPDEYQRQVIKENPGGFLAQFAKYGKRR